MTPNSLVPLAIVALVAIRMYSRVRRNIGRQQFRPKRLIAGTIILAILTCVLGVYCFLYPRLLPGLGGGLVLGVLLALIGLRLTRIETKPEGRFYTPNPYIGVALSVLFVGRLVYRLVLLSSISGNPTQTPPSMQSPLSFFVYELFAGYYMAYYIGLLWKSKTSSS